MPLFNVEVSFKTLLVVQADNEDHAHEVAGWNAHRVLNDVCPSPNISVRGMVSRERDLREGWTTECVPYGGDGNTRLGDLLVELSQEGGE